MQEEYGRLYMQKQLEKTFSLKSIPDQPWMQQELDSVSIKTPQTDGLSTLSLLKSDAGKDRKLRKAASYRYIHQNFAGKERQRDIAQRGEMIIRLESLNGGGLAIYGRDFGRYPFDVSLVIKK